MGGMKEKLRRIERVVAGEEPITQKQASILTLDVIGSMYDEFEPAIKQVPKNVTAIATLKVRVVMGIGLTALAAILGIALAIAG